MSLIVLFIFFPFIAFIFCLKDLRKPVNAFIFIAFYALYGYCIHFQLITADITRIGYGFQYADIDNIMNIIESGNKADLYSSFIFIWLLPFTNNPKIFTAIIALIYGILSYGVFVNVYRYWPRARKGWFYIYILILLSNISLVQMTGVRFYTGALLFILSVLNYLKGKKLWAIGVCVVPLIHFSLAIAVGSFIIYLLFGKWFINKRVCKFALIISFIVSFIPLGSAAQGIFNDAEIENSSLNTKVNAYTGGGSNMTHNKQISTYRQTNRLYTQIFNIINRAGLFLILMRITKIFNQKFFSVFSRKLYRITIISSCFGLMSLSLTPVAERFLHISWCFFLILFPILLGVYKNFKISKWDKWLVFANFYSISYFFINTPRFVTPLLWIMNLPYLIYDGINFRITWDIFL